MDVNLPSEIKSTLADRRAFPYVIELDRLSRANGGDGNFLLSGHVTNLGTDLVVVGGQTRGSINLGFRVIRGAGREIAFEDRVQLSSSQLKSGEQTRFSARFPQFEIQDLIVEMDFVCEDEFWFFEASGQPAFEVTVARLLYSDNRLEKSTPIPLEQADSVSTAKPKDKSKAPRRPRQSIAHQPTLTDPVRRYVFDLSDLIQFWHDNIRPTGIQRVQIEVLREIMLGHIAPELLEVPCIAICFRVASHSWSRLPEADLLRQIELSSSPRVTKADWLMEIGQLLVASATYIPETGDALINLGSSWWIPDYLHKIQILRKERGIRYIPFIHDTIPLTTPEYCAAGLVDEFKMWFRGAASLADHIVVNSNSSKRDVARWSDKLLGGCCDISVATLDAAFVRPPSSSKSGLLERLNLDTDRYVLCVGTLEARKNHSLLFQVWTELQRRIAPERIAKLVLVGKEGWMFEAARALLARSRVLSEYVIILHNLSDQELSELYENCLFTVYPSFYEGWGLPITEAISYRKLTVASNTSSIPEAASPGDVLLDPDDFLGWYETIAKLLEDDDFLASSTEISSTRAELRAWSDIANDILGAAKHSQRRIGMDTPATATDGTIYDFQIDTARQNFECSAYPFRSGSGWHHLEDWGAWSADGVTELKFSVQSRADRFLYLVVRGGPENSKLTISVDGKTKLRREILTDQRVIFRVSLGENGKMEHSVRLVVYEIVDLALKTDGADSRKIGIAFHNMMICLTGDFLSRLNFNEAMQMHFI